MIAHTATDGAIIGNLNAVNMRMSKKRTRASKVAPAPGACVDCRRMQPIALRCIVCGGGPIVETTDARFRVPSGILADHIAAGMFYPGMAVVLLGLTVQAGRMIYGGQIVSGISLAVVVLLVTVVMAGVLIVSHRASRTAPPTIAPRSRRLRAVATATVHRGIARGAAGEVRAWFDDQPCLVAALRLIDDEGNALFEEVRATSFAVVEADGARILVQGELILDGAPTVHAQARHVFGWPLPIEQFRDGEARYAQVIVRDGDPVEVRGIEEMTAGTGYRDSATGLAIVGRTGAPVFVRV